MSETLTTTTTDVVASAEEQAAEQVGALAQQIVGMLGSATELLTIELGRRFGLYRALHEAGPMTAHRVRRRHARRAALRPRVARTAGGRRLPRGRRARSVRA